MFSKYISIFIIISNDITDNYKYLDMLFILLYQTIYPVSFILITAYVTYIHCVISYCAVVDYTVETCYLT